MASSFLDHERRNPENIKHIDDDDDKDSRKTKDRVDGNPAEQVAGSILLAAGDGDMKSFTAASPGSKSSVNFLAEETAQTRGFHATGKRKRDSSPEIPLKESIEEIRGSEESSEEADDDKSGAVPTTDALSAHSHINSKPNAVMIKSIDDELPDTVTLLKTPEGAKVYLVGTAHFSMESQEDVAKIIQAVQPHVVLVELCKARVNILQLDEKTILEEAKNINFEKIYSTVKQNGLFRGMMYILLLSMSAHITKELGMAPGGEFRRAFAEAKKFPHCIVHLGDRPIHITLQRALAALSWWQTIRVSWHLIMSKGPISKEEVERCKQRDLLEEMLAEMAGEFPDLSTVFVKERDIYLTQSLQLAAAISPPLAANGWPPRVVGIVGIGHVPGIVEHWGKVHPEDIPPLLYIPPPSVASRVVRVGVRLSLIGIVLWGCYRILPIQRITPKISALRIVVQNALQ